MVNLPACTSVKKEEERQAFTVVSSALLGSRLVKSISMRGKVNGSLLGRFEEGTWVLSMAHSWP